MGSPLAGAWLFFHIAGCAVLLYNGKYETTRSWLWYACTAWLLMLGLSAFFFASVAGAAATMFILASMPSLALCLRKEHIKPYFICFLSVATVYAIGLVLQMYFNVTYDNYNIGSRRAWPLLDPNNAAAVINLAFIPCMYLMWFSDLRWALLSAVFATALYATGSKAGFGGAGLALMIITVYRYGAECMLGWLMFITACIGAAFAGSPDLVVMVVNSLRDRFPIWDITWQLIWVRPWGGLGLGSFGAYYQQFRTETYTAGWYAHNDTLQLAVETGVPGAMVFAFLMLLAILTTNRSNLITGVTMLAIFAESMVEFQFYVPPVSLAMGVALGCHMINYRRGGLLSKRGLYSSE